MMETTSSPWLMTMACESMMKMGVKTFCLWVETLNAHSGRTFNLASGTASGCF
jgi:hypothetical protein